MKATQGGQRTESNGRDISGVGGYALWSCVHREHVPLVCLERTLESWMLVSVSPSRFKERSNKCNYARCKNQDPFWKGVFKQSHQITSCPGGPQMSCTVLKHPSSVNSSSESVWLTPMLDLVTVKWIRLAKWANGIECIGARSWPSKFLRNLYVWWTVDWQLWMKNLSRRLWHLELDQIHVFPYNISLKQGETD